MSSESNLRLSVMTQRFLAPSEPLCTFDSYSYTTAAVCKLLGRLSDIDVTLDVSSFGAMNGASPAGIGLRRFQPGPASLMERLTLKVSRSMGLGRPLSQGVDFRIFRQEFGGIRALQSDIVCLVGLGPDIGMSGLIAQYCRQAGKPLVLFLSEFRDFSPAHYSRSRQYDGHIRCGDLGSHIIASADLVVVADVTLARQIGEQHHVKTIVVPAWQDLDDAADCMAEGGRGVVWAGSSRLDHGPEVLSQLAMLLPDVNFTVLLCDEEYSFQRHLVSGLPGNVYVIENPTNEQVAASITASALLLDTSKGGHLNAPMILALRSGRPIVSLNTDPSGLFSIHGAGHVAWGQLDQMAGQVERLLGSLQEWRVCSTSGREWLRSIAGIGAVDLSSAMRRLVPTRSNQAGVP